MRGVIFIKERKKTKWSGISFISMVLVMVILLCSLSVAPAQATENTVIGTAICTARSRINMRSGPSTAYRKVGAGLPGGAIVEVNAKSGNWYQFTYNGTTAWGYSSYLRFISSSPSTTLASVTVSSNNSSVQTGRTYAIYYQGSSKWRFTRTVAKKACLITAYAITISNMGISATPRTVYQSNGNSCSMNIDRMAASFGVRPVCALNADSQYLRGFNGCQTYINNPSKNAVPAIKEALDKNPEGVIVSFRKGSKAHSIVACRYEGDTIYYSDPGRTRTTLLIFNNTWVRYKHRMTYANVDNIVALDTI